MGLYDKYILPRVLEFGMSRPQVMRERPRALAEARGEVLEIGFGTGLNLASYPPAVERLVVADPVEMLAPRVAQRIAAAKIPVSIERADAAVLPFDAGRFDCVVSTWTLCTIPRVAQSLAEIRRVLKPSGRFLFLEHGLSQNPRTADWQHRLDRLHGFFTGGCHVNREIDQLVAGAGLAIERVDRFNLAGVPGYMAPHYLGAAIVA
ncbi:MAG TPA: class I SAM-dependent methyltransferase [Pirellulales bacterium]|jgi:ubiquinone/menaquinone biosynthesis C-methylase UbiE